MGVPLDVISASFEELQIVEGIGKDTAERIKWVASYPMLSYGILNANLEILIRIGYRQI